MYHTSKIYFTPILKTMIKDEEMKCETGTTELRFNKLY